MEKHLTELVEFVKSVSPAVWDSFIYQQYILAFATLLLTFLSVLVLVYGKNTLKSKPKWACDQFGDNVGGAVIFVMGSILTFIFAMISVMDSLPRLLNPAYYAIKALLELSAGIR